MTGPAAGRIARPGPLPVGPAHAAALAAIHAATFPPAERWSAAAIVTQLALPGVFALLAPGGGMALARVAADEAEILTLAVVPSARRRGIGAALLRATQTHAASAGALRLLLEVSAGNAAARALYAAAGLRELWRRPRYYADGSDALVLAGPLSRAAAARG